MQQESLREGICYLYTPENIQLFIYINTRFHYIKDISMQKDYIYTPVSVISEFLLDITNIRLWTASLALLEGSVVLAGCLVDGHSVRAGISGYYTAGKRVGSVPPFLGSDSNCSWEILQCLFRTKGCLVDNIQIKGEK